MQDHLIRNYSI